MQNITIDHILFEVWGDKVLWSSLSANGEFIEAPEDWARLARALVLCDYRDEGERVYVLDSVLHEHFIDSHDDAGNKVPGGRSSNLHFPLKPGLSSWARAKSVMTGRLDGTKIISVLEWDDPLDNVLTAREAETRFGLAEGTVKKTLQRGKIAGRKSGGTWLVRTRDADRQWS